MDRVSARVAELRSALSAIDGPGWIVGGAIRDAVLGEPISDVDIALAGDAAVAARAVAGAFGATRFALSDAFGAWRVSGGRLPFTVDITPLQGATIDEDLARRDLTVNAMAVPLSTGDMVDPHNGREDLDRRLLRMVGADAFRNDPVRIARLARLANHLGFAVDDATRLRARLDAGGLATAAGERVFAEMAQMAAHARAARAYELFDEVGGLGVVIPELEEGRGLEQTPYHHKDVLGHTLEVVAHACEIRSDPAAVFRADAPLIAELLGEPLADDMTRGDGLVLACLFHDMAKPATYAVTADGRATFFGHDRVGADLADAWCRRHRTSNRVRETMAQLVRGHLVLGFMVHRQPLSLRQILRYVDGAAPAVAEAVVLSCADRLATNGPRTTPPQIDRHLDVARQVVRGFARLRAQGSPPPLLDGVELIALGGRPPGPWTANLVAALREEQLVGMVTTREQAERFARRWAERTFADPVE